jgi:hypothetical protein
MTVLTWDQVGERTYETGVDRGVLFIPDAGGDYNEGVAWNGLTTVTEAPSGAGATALYADNIKYLNLIAAEEFGGTIAAYTYPDEFGQCDGTVEPEPGVSVGQQGRKVFGLCYRTRFGNDSEGVDHGYKLHLVYGAQAAPSQKAYGSINNSPSAIDFSWTFTTTPVPVTGHQPTALLVIDSTKVGAAQLTALEDTIYGTAGVDPRLPLPDEVITMMGGAVTAVRLTEEANTPTYNAATHVVTLPAVTGVQWKVNGVDAAPGAQPAMGVGDSSLVEAEPEPGYEITGDNDWVFDY